MQALAYGTLSESHAKNFLACLNTDNAAIQVTISQAKEIVHCLAATQSVILFSAPGVGKSDAIRQCAESAGLECKSLLGTQIAPEDVSGIPRIIGERSVFCPPRVLLPERAEKFCLFLDELPACTPDIQKAFYSLLLERRIGEYKLPEGTWVVSAGNRLEDRSLVQDISSALMNRLIVLNLKVSTQEWLIWAAKNGIRQEIISYITFNPQALQRNVPQVAAPFSTPRAWAALSHSLDLLERRGGITSGLLEALAFGAVSPQDAAVFVNFRHFKLHEFRSLDEYITHPENIPDRADPSALAARFFILHSIRQAAIDDEHPWYPALRKLPGEAINAFLSSLAPEDRIVILLGAVKAWAKLGAEKQLMQTLKDLTGVSHDHGRTH